MRPRINKAMIEMNQRWLASEDRLFKIVLREQHMRGDDLAWLSGLSRRKLEALDALPVSLFRWHYSTLRIDRTELTDEEFRDIGNKMAVFLESCHYAIMQNLAPMVAIGCDEQCFTLFSSGSFQDRMQLLRRGGFSLGPRSSLRLMRLDLSSPEAMLHDTTLILLGDIRHFSKPKTLGLGMLQDYGNNIPSDSIAREMLRIRIQPKLVEQYTGLPQESVSRIKRSLLRTLPYVQSHPGRIQVATKTLAEQPLDCHFYLAIYRLLAKDALRKTNARAVVAAYRQYEAISSALGFSEEQRISASNAYQLSNALKTGDITLTPCGSCKELMIRDTLKPKGCMWCGN